MAFSVKLPWVIEKRLIDLAAQTGRSRTFFVRQAIESQLDELEDIYVSEKRLENNQAGRSKAFTFNKRESSVDWQINLDEEANKELTKLGKAIDPEVMQFLRDNLTSMNYPHSIGHALKTSRLGSFWQYQNDDYRVVTHIDNDTSCILILKIRNKHDVYQIDDLPINYETI